MSFMSHPQPWYQEGLQFECTQCGNCCSGPPGVVWVNPDEIKAIAQFIGSKNGILNDLYLRRVGWKFSLTEKPGGDCIFLKRDGGKAFCSIYPVRPVQCRTWPFWNGLLKSRNAWEQATQSCPGMNKGKHYGFVEIEALRVKRS